MEETHIKDHVDEPPVYDDEGESQVDDESDRVSTSVHMVRSASNVTKRGRRGKQPKKRSIEEVLKEEPSITPAMEEENRTPIHKPSLKNIISRSPTLPICVHYVYQFMSIYVHVKLGWIIVKVGWIIVK